mmetsp:Transcript_32155/g.84931  ORF Transcript_32155/g.84931 Transcript_32155/m.84931 type:complete len:318 (+) Transcript_32155:459-1412(+)
MRRRRRHRLLRAARRLQGAPRRGRGAEGAGLEGHGERLHLDRRGDGELLPGAGPDAARHGQRPGRRPRLGTEVPGPRERPLLQRGRPAGQERDAARPLVRPRAAGLHAGRVLRRLGLHAPAGEGGDGREGLRARPGRAPGGAQGLRHADRGRRRALPRAAVQQLRHRCQRRGAIPTGAPRQSAHEPAGIRQDRAVDPPGEPLPPAAAQHGGHEDHEPRGRAARAERLGPVLPPEENADRQGVQGGRLPEHQLVQRRGDLGLGPLPRRATLVPVRLWPTARALRRRDGGLLPAAGAAVLREDRHHAPDRQEAGRHVPL